MAVVGFVLLAILALLLLLLCIPIVGSARFSSDAPGEAYVRWLFYRRQLLGKKQKKRSRAKKKQKKQKEQVPARPQRRRSGISRRSLVRQWTSSRRSAAARRCFCGMCASTVCACASSSRRTTPAQTAITFGHMNALIYTAYTAARGLFNLKKPDILITPNFMAQEGSWQFEARGR